MPAKFDLGPRRMAALAAAILAAALTVAAVAAANGYDDAARPGDLLITANGLAWRPDRLRAPAGRVEVLIDNQDAIRHDLTIDGIVTVDIPGRRTRRTVLDLPPGTYLLRCTLHDGMDLTMTVAGGI